MRSSSRMKPISLLSTPPSRYQPNQRQHCLCVECQSSLLHVISVLPCHVSIGGPNGVHEANQMRSPLCLVSSVISSPIFYTQLACLLTRYGHTTSSHPMRHLHSALELAVLTYLFTIPFKTLWWGPSVYQVTMHFMK